MVRLCIADSEERPRKEENLPLAFLQVVGLHPSKICVKILGEKKKIDRRPPDDSNGESTRGDVRVVVVALDDN